MIIISIIRVIVVNMCIIILYNIHDIIINIYIYIYIRTAAMWGRGGGHVVGWGGVNPLRVYFHIGYRILDIYLYTYHICIPYIYIYVYIHPQIIFICICTYV